MPVELVDDIEVGDERGIAIELAVGAVLDCIIGRLPVEDLGGKVVLHVCRLMVAIAVAGPCGAKAMLCVWWCDRLSIVCQSGVRGMSVGEKQRIISGNGTTR